MKLEKLIYEEVKRLVNEVYKVPTNNYIELGLNAVSKKKKYAKRLWDLIQRNYAYIGGCKTFDEVDGDGGFNDFLYGRYIWKLFFGKSQKDIKGAIIYKATRYGRKRVCSVAVDRETYNKLSDSDFFKGNHVYGEVSGKAENSLLKDKRTNWIPKEEVSKIIDKPTDLEQDVDVDSTERIPYDAFRHYYRNLGGEKHRKAMFGHPIKSKNNDTI